MPLDDWNYLVDAESSLQQDNRALKRRLAEATDCAKRERRRAAALQQEFERVERDRDCLAVRIRDERRRRDAREEACAWKEKYEMARAVIEEKDAVIAEERNANALRSRLLKRHGIVGW